MRFKKFQNIRFIKTKKIVFNLQLVQFKIKSTLVKRDANRDVNRDYIYSLMNDKKDAQNIWFKDLVHEEPFGYRVADLLMSCPGSFRTLFQKRC